MFYMINIKKKFKFEFKSFNKIYKNKYENKDDDDNNNDDNNNKDNNNNDDEYKETKMESSSMITTIVSEVTDCTFRLEKNTKIITINLMEIRYKYLTMYKSSFVNLLFNALNIAAGIPYLLFFGSITTINNIFSYVWFTPLLSYYYCEGLLNIIDNFLVK